MDMNTAILKIQSHWRGVLQRRQIYTMIEKYHNLYLKEKGVRLPSETSAFGQALCCLYYNLRKPVNIDTLRKYVIEKGVILSGGADTLQIRHLALQYGFNMLKGGELDPFTNNKIPKSHYMLLDLKHPHPSFIKDKRKEEINEEEWNILKKEYNYECACCGNKEGSPLRYNKYKITHLQKGHMDPSKGLTLDNIIPQCQDCNQQYKNKAVFNKRGYIIDFNKTGIL